jgi:hypothetical protein
MEKKIRLMGVIGMNHPLTEHISLSVILWTGSNVAFGPNLNMECLEPPISVVFRLRSLGHHFLPLPYTLSIQILSPVPFFTVLISNFVSALARWVCEWMRAIMPSAPLGPIMKRVMAVFGLISATRYIRFAGGDTGKVILNGPIRKDDLKLLFFRPSLDSSLW